MKTKYILILLVISLLASACYVNSEVEANEVAVILEQNEIKDVVGPGVYTDMGWWADIKTVKVDTVTFSVEDPEVLTSDSQPVGVKITIQARRQASDEAVINLFTNWSSLVNTDNLVLTISATAREGLKNGVHEFTLPQLLSDRSGLADAIKGQINLDAAKYNAEIINVTIENITVDPTYLQTLNETAQFTAQINKEKQRQELIKQQTQTDILASEQQALAAQAQVLAEQAETEVQVEIARRQGEIVAAANEVYLNNPAAFDLERLRLLAQIYGDKTMFISPDTNLFINPGQFVPVQ